MTSSTLFVFVISASFIAWAFSIYETLSTNLFKESSFRIGFSIFIDNFILTENNAQIDIGRKHDIDGGQYKFTNKNTCLFHSKMSVFESISEFSILPVKGIVSWHQGRANIEARIPLGQTIFFICLLSTQAVGTSLIPSDAPGRFSAIVFMVTCLLGGFTVFMCSLHSLKKRTKGIAEIIKQHITGSDV